MLSHLTIHNFGLIDEVSMEFCGSLNILTGATGAGKSIIIDGLRFALGERLDSSQIRDKDKPCLVEAVFDLNKKVLRQEVFKDFLSDEETPLIISRQFLPDGRNKIKINGFNVTVTQLKNMGDHLIDFHGPNDHQMLLAQESHIAILDQLADFGESMKDYQTQYQQYLRLQGQLKNMKELASSRERDLDLLTHQIKELEQVSLSQEKYEELCQEQVRINNAGKLYENASSLLQILEGNETGLSEMVRQAFLPLKALIQIDEQTKSMEEFLIDIQENSAQLISTLRDYLDGLSFEPDEAQQISRKYDIYEDIKRKYGPALEDAEKFYREARAKYELLIDFEQNDLDLKRQLSELEQQLKKSAAKLTKVRRTDADSLKKTIEKELKDLGIEHVKFEARIAQAEFQPNGSDQVTFYISPNAGESLKPLAEIVSSGEAARLMLALKKALTKVDPIPVLIFDEIDAQIGGRLGTITGKKLKELSSDRQVILITHLPQIASFADRHFKVNKKVVKGRTITTIDLLDEKACVQELAHMMAGDQKTNISVSHAEKMLADAQKQ